MHRVLRQVKLTALPRNAREGPQRLGPVLGPYGAVEGLLTLPPHEGASI